MNRCTVAALAQILRWKMAITPQQNVPKPCCVPCSSDTAAWTASTALVNCGEGFTQPEKVVDGFSDTCMEILQERGYHTRTIMGTHNMPNHNIPVEVEMIFVLADRYRNTLGGNQDVCV